VSDFGSINEEQSADRGCNSANRSIETPGWLSFGSAHLGREFPADPPLKKLRSNGWLTLLGLFTPSWIAQRQCQNDRQLLGLFETFRAAYTYRMDFS
jgi:hypothetical protein